MRLSPNIAPLILLLATSTFVSGEERVLFDFENPDAARSWQTVNDGVMGGRSVGRVRYNEDKKLEFFGTLSLANNGGFASVRTRIEPPGMRPGDVIVIRVRGDGREYNLNVYADRNLGGYSYRRAFKTLNGKWAEVSVPIDSLVATWRGRRFPQQTLDPARVSGIGILLGDKKPGAFKLEVESIKVRSGSE